MSDARKPDQKLRSGKLTPRPASRIGQLLSSTGDASATPGAQVPSNSDGIVVDERIGNAFKGYGSK